MDESKIAFIFLLILLFIVLIRSSSISPSIPIQLAKANQKNESSTNNIQPIKKIVIFENEIFNHTGRNLKLIKVNTSNLENCDKIILNISGKSFGDNLPRYFLVKVNNRIVNSKPGDEKWPLVSGEVYQNFNYEFDITNLINNKNLDLEVGITTYTGYWNLSAELLCYKK